MKVLDPISAFTKGFIAIDPLDERPLPGGTRVTLQTLSRWEQGTTGLLATPGIHITDRLNPGKKTIVTISNNPKDIRNVVSINFSRNT